MQEIRVYLYNSEQESNGYRGENLSAFVLQGTTVNEDLTQILDTGEITLAGYTEEKNFAPETKMIVDIVETETNAIVETLHYCVERDVVEQPILSDDNYFNHHIFLIEPSVVAQKRLVDNISATYKLKDVTLVTEPAFDLTKKTSLTFGRPDISKYQYCDYVYSYDYGNFYTQAASYRKYLWADGKLQFQTQAGTNYDTLYNNISNFEVSTGVYRAKFVVPKVAIMHGEQGDTTPRVLGYASIDATIQEFDLNNEENPLRSWTYSFISNSDLSTRAITNETWKNEWLCEDIRLVSNTLRFYYRKYTSTSATTPTYITPEIDIQPNKSYRVTISLHQFPDSIPAPDYTTIYPPLKYTGSDIATWVEGFYDRQQGESSARTYTNRGVLTTNQASASGNIFTYSIDAEVLVYSSSVPYSALALLQKAIINSSIYEKEDGVYIADINASKLPFYIDNVFVNELATTKIVENFYNQKNLWEIMVEVGNYIHAIPEIRFGADDRFLITFNKLGRTDEHESTATKVSIFNSRSVEDYISATSSYISNMVQLGGFIEEWVAPKTNAETLLVSNDTANITVSKPIIELLEIKVKCNVAQADISAGAVADMTNFVYEKNVYNTLGIEYDKVPNRGISLYYELGGDSIIGGDYQLPQANNNLYSDYAIKKVIYCAFKGYKANIPLTQTSGYWGDIKVTDFTFYVKYRTKDSVRQNHARPDLRKYLLNSKYDRFPEHNQFNNQTDVVVDSIKFGNNMYGKLIRTGNNSYTVTEWLQDYSQIKHKGELYRIQGELYYVAQATHIFYATYIVSKITYSKDYNELSQVIGIPSEPRFYEISEQSLIWRELAINDFVLLTDNSDNLFIDHESKENYLIDITHLANLIFGVGTDFAKYALTVFKGDKDVNTYDQTVGESDLYLELLNPINAYASENTLTYEWDMKDNYSAGDQVLPCAENSSVAVNTRAYKTLRAVKYTDIYGRAALLDFYILGNKGLTDLSQDEISAFPNSPIKTKNFAEDTRPFVGSTTFDLLASNVKAYDTNFNGRGIGLLKDCREAMSINYNLQLITSSDTFVVSPFVFLPNKTNLKLVLLTDEVNKLSQGYVSNAQIITPKSTTGLELSPFFDISLTVFHNHYAWGQWRPDAYMISIDDILAQVNEGHFNGDANYTQVKAIALLCDVSLDTGTDSTDASFIPYKTQFVVARNLPEEWTVEQKKRTWFIGSPSRQLFREKQ